MGSPSKNKRYSDELLTAVRYLLTVADPIREAKYFSGLQQFTSEPSETLGIVRSNAYTALENCADPTEPVLSEDYLFIQVEERIQQQRSTRLVGEVGSWRDTSIFAAAVVSLSAGGLFWTEGLLWAGMFFGGLFALVGVPAAIVAWFRLRQTKEVLRWMKSVIAEAF